MRDDEIPASIPIAVHDILTGTGSTTSTTLLGRHKLTGRETFAMDSESMLHEINNLKKEVRKNKENHILFIKDSEYCCDVMNIVVTISFVCIYVYVFFFSFFSLQVKAAEESALAAMRQLKLLDEKLETDQLKLDEDAKAKVRIPNNQKKNEN